MTRGERVFVFGPFRLSETARQLLRDGVAVVLPSRAFDLLAALLARGGSTVSRDALLRQVWPDGRPVHENNLAVQMSALRRALGATRDGQAYIATVPGRGFQFVAPVSIELQAADEPVAGIGNIPPPANRLIGRAEILAGAAAALEQSRLVTLTGPSGIGKTRAAQAVALAISDRFPDGAWLIDLAPLTEPTLLAATVATTLALPAGAEEVTADSLARSLRGHAVLLVLDNCEHLRDAVAALVASLLAGCPGIRILATSHERLDLPEERLCPVETLAVPPAELAVTAQALQGFPACELFIERARALDRRFAVTDGSAAILAEICRRLDGIPLAIELAASRQPILGLEQVLRGLDDRFRLLVGGERVVVARHLTLRAAHDWAWSLLPPAVQQSLVRLSVFAGGFDAAALAMLADGRPDELLDHVVMLAERSLLAVDPTEAGPRYRLLDSTRAYAAGRLEERGEAPVMRRRHAAWFAQLFETAERGWETSSTARWQAGLFREIDNLRAALGWAFGAEGDVRLGRRLTAASLRLFHNARLVPEYRVWLERAVAGPGVEDRLMARLWLAVARSILNLPRRIEAAERAIALARVQGDADALGRALAIRGETLRRAGDMDGAAALLEKAMVLLASVEAVKSCADVSQQLAVIRFHQGDVAASRALNADALARYRAAEHESGIIACLIRVANDHFDAGAPEEAVAAVSEALSFSRRIRNGYLVELTLGNLASYEIARGNWPAALAAAKEALPVAIQVDDQGGIATLAQLLAEIAFGLAAPETAASLLGFSETLFEAEQEARDPAASASYAALVAALEQALDPATLVTCRGIGAKWTAEIVLAAIGRLVLPRAED